MAKKLVVTISLALCAGFASGCAPDAEKVCKHLMKVYEKSMDKPRYLEDLDKCTASYEAKKKRRGVNSYRREVECILGSSTSFNVRKCVKAEDDRANND